MALAPGHLIDEKYQIAQLLGRGGMGEVWAAERLSDGRAVAIKVLLERASRRPDIVRRFEREAQAASRIQSRHVCALLDQGTTGQGRLFLVFERLRGESLADRLRREQYLPFDEVALLTCDVLRGIADAHEAHVLHRDLKPGNIFIANDETNSEYGVVLDFGVSKLLHEVRQDEEPSLTAFNGTVGSFAYMAPEQVRGAARVDERADVYGAAAVAFRAISGRLPFEGLSAKMVASLKLDNPPPTLSQMAGMRFPRAVEEFFARAIARKPEHRFGSARETLRALERLISANARARERACRALKDA